MAGSLTKLAAANYTLGKDNHGWSLIYSVVMLFIMRWIAIRDYEWIG
jgi:hypothetical protein